MKFAGITYISGFTNPKMPAQTKNFNLIVDQEGITVYYPVFYKQHQERIPLLAIEAIDNEVTVDRKTLSAGKALGGAVLFGPIGAIVGASMGSKRKHTQLTITHTAAGRIARLTIDSRNNTKLEQTIYAELDKANLTL